MIGLIRNEMDRRIMTTLIPKMYSYLTDDGWVSGCAKQNLKLSFMITEIICRKMN